MHPKFNKEAFDSVAQLELGEIHIDVKGNVYEYQQLIGFGGDLFFKWQLLGNIKKLFNKESEGE